MNTWHFINRESYAHPETGAFNMALDEALFLLYADSREPVFRLYQWDNPCLSLGLNQDARGLVDFGGCAARGVEIVRRMTGGGAILHDREATYSLVAGREVLGKGVGVRESYRKLTEFLVGMYRSWGLDAAYAGENAPSLPAASSLNFPDTTNGRRRAVCFAAKERYDICIQGKKLGGNAQRWGKDWVFQHGSIPYSITPHILSACLRDMSGTVTKSPEIREKGGNSLEHFGLCCTVTELFDSLRDSFEKTYQAGLIWRPLNPREEDTALGLMEQKYAAEEWTRCGSIQG